MTNDDMNLLRYAFGYAQDAMGDDTFIAVQGALARLGRHVETERRQFAAMAMQGMLSDHERNGSYDHYAMYAVAQADALIEALNTQKATP